MKSSKNCISCGMPLEKSEDYPLNDETKDYCKYCANEDGSMKSFEECVNGMSEFLTEAKDISEVEAKELAIKMLKKNPAWKES